MSTPRQCSVVAAILAVAFSASLAGQTPATSAPPSGIYLLSAEGAKELAECLYNRRAELARQTLLASTKEAADAAYRKLILNSPKPRVHRSVPGVDPGLAAIVDRR